MPKHNSQALLVGKKLTLTQTQNTDSPELSVFFRTEDQQKPCK